MVMAVKLVHHQPSNNTVVAVGYEGGFIGIHLLPQDQTMRLQETRKQIQMTQIVYLSQPHTQPVLSLDASPDGTTYFTSSADAVIAAHRIPELPLVVHHQDSKYSKNSVSAGPYEETSAKPDQASATQRLPTPGLDSMPLLSADSDLNQTRSTFGQRNETSSEVGSADLLTFSKKHVVPINSATKSSASDVKPAGLSSLLSPATPLSKEKTSPFPIPDVTTPQQPYRVISSKHAGQQSLRVRSDGRLFVTGGWDSRIRIYSTKTLKEMAVLKWHKQGVYAVDFGEVLSADYLTNNQEKESGEDGVRDMPVVKKETGLGRLQRQREEQMQVKHWVAAGAKDGKVSLWEVF
jgi:WD40 repeat protein